MKAAPRDVPGILKALPSGIRLVLLHGSDEGKIREYAKAFAAQVVGATEDPFSTVDLAGDRIAEDPALLADEAGTISMLGGRRLIRVNAVGDGVMAAVENCLANKTGDSLVLLLGPGLQTTSKLVKALGSAKDALTLACYADEGRDRRGFAEESLRQAGIALDRDAMSHLLDVLPEDRAASRSELEKLALYAMGQPRLGLEDIRAVIGDGADVQTDELAHLAFEGRQDGLMRNLDRALGEGTHPLVVVTGAARHAERLLMLKGLLGQGRALDQALPSAGFRGPVWKLKDRLAAQAARWTEIRLARAMRHLLDAEIQMKQAQAPVELLCSRVLLDVARAAAAGSRR